MPALHRNGEMHGTRWREGRGNGPPFPIKRGRRRVECVLVGSIAMILRQCSAWQFSDILSLPRVPGLPLNITVVYGEPAGQEWLSGSFTVKLTAERSPGTPQAWDSSSCLASWNASELRTKVDPAGYVVFSEGREQLGNNRFLISDGMVIAKTLNRTLIEFPMKNSRIHSPDADLGLCDYWHCEKLCDNLGQGEFPSACHVYFPLCLFGTKKFQRMLHSPFDRKHSEFPEYADVNALKRRRVLSIFATPTRPTPQFDRYHRILDLRTFRAMLRDGRVIAEDFVSLISADWEKSLLPNLVTAKEITDFFWNYQQSKVIVLNMAWKSGLRREPVELLRPNLFYSDTVERLVAAQEGWDDGQFVAVQWRTETSVGNLTDCYHRYVQPTIEEHRKALGLTRGQVFFNTDLVGQASTTYKSSVVQANQGVIDRIREYYPTAMDNTVYDLLREEEDAGVRAMISGLVSASARLLLSSSFAGSGDRECQKRYSKYIDLVVEWRLGLEEFNNSADSIVKLFPDVELEQARLFVFSLRFFVIVGIFGGFAVLVANRKGAAVLEVSNSKRHDP